MDCITLIHSDKALLTSAGEIRRLHGEIIDAARSTLDKALRVGELLADVKQSLPHGEFGAWCAQGDCAILGNLLKLGSAAY